MTDEQKLTLLLKVLKEYAETPHCYDKYCDDFNPNDYTNGEDAFGDGIDCGEIMFARTLLEQIGVEFEYPVMKKMTNKEVAQEVLYSYMDVEKDLSQPKILLHTLKELRKLISYSNENVDFKDELNVMYASGWGDALKQIDAVCDELEAL